MEEYIRRIKELKKMLKDGRIARIQDDDTLLCDVMNDADFQVNDIVEEILQTWETTSDKKSVEKMFFIFTEMSMEDFLKMVKGVMEAQEYSWRLKETSGTNRQKIEWMENGRFRILEDGSVYADKEFETAAEAFTVAVELEEME